MYVHVLLHNVAQLLHVWHVLKSNFKLYLATLSFANQIFSVLVLSGISSQLLQISAQISEIFTPIRVNLHSLTQTRLFVYCLSKS